MYDRSRLWACCGTAASLYFCICFQSPQKDSGLLNSISLHPKKKKKKKEKKKKRRRERDRESIFAKKRKSGTNKV
jgi:hypothetical protein